MLTLLVVSLLGWSAVPVPGAAASPDPGVGSPAPAQAVAAPPATATDPGPGAAADAPFVEGELIVGFRPGAAAASQAAALKSVGIAATKPLSPLSPSTVLAKIGGGGTTRAAAKALTANPNVAFAEPNYLLTSTASSNDPYVVNGSLWGMYGDTTTPANTFGSQAAEAWASGWTGSSGVYVGVIDEGFDTTHPDLVDNVWVNDADPVNGVDDDGNGYLDDVNGWDFFNNDNSVFDGPDDDHGTHVAGTIGGVGGNGVGVAGVNWDVTLISGKFLGPNGGTVAGAVRAIDYMTALKTQKGLGIVATSNSWGGGGFSQALLDAINRGGDAGIVFVAAAGNSGSNNEQMPFYPANYRCTTTAAGQQRGWDCLVSVAAIDATGAKASFSSYGALAVDLGAPGVAVTSTLPGAAYGSYSGTSMATPHVSGSVALCAAINPALPARLLRNAVLSSVAATASLAELTVTGGRLDVGSMVGRCVPPTGPVSGGPSGLVVTAPNALSVELAWTDGTTGESYQEIQQAGADCANPVTVATVAADATRVVFDQLQPSTTYCYRVRAGNAFDTGSGPSTSDWTPFVTFRTADAPAPYRCTAVPYAWDGSVGMTFAMGDDTAANVGMGFNFTFYDTDYNRAYVGSNGLLSFVYGTAVTSPVNYPVPSSVPPNAIVAALWDDLNPAAGGTVTTATVGTYPNRRFVASWNNVRHAYVTGSAVTFQIVLEEATDTIVLQYADTSVGYAAYDRGGSATVGLESADGFFGTQVGYNRAVVGDRTALRCGRGASAAPSIATTGLPTGYLQNPYSAAMTVQGGSAPYTWTVVGGSLPAGLSLSSGTGTVTGTPMSVGASTVTVEVLDAEGRTARSTLSMTVEVGVVITTTALPPGGLTQAYSAAITATGGTAPYRFTSVGLPPGLVLDPDTGVLSGMPTTVASYGFSVTATDSSPMGLIGKQFFQLEITAAPDVTTTTLVPGMVTASLQRTLSVTGGKGPFVWSVADAGLPPGVVLYPNGQLSGTPTQAGTWPFTVRVTDAIGRVDDQALSLTVDPLLLVATSSLPGASLGQAYASSLAATGGSGTYGWSLSGQLPPGLALSAEGIVSGTPTASGSYGFNIGVRDTLNRWSWSWMTLSVTAPLAVSTAAVPGATVGVAYSAALAASGGSGSNTWALAGGGLPAGLTLSGGGVLAGVPTTAGTSSFTVRVTDSEARTALRAYSVNVVQGPTMRVSAITLTKVVSKSLLSGTAVVTVVNGSGQVLGSVSVTGVFTLNGASPTTRTATTGTKGTATFGSPTSAFATGKTIRFCVTSLARSGYAFDPSGPSCAGFVS